MHSASRRQFLSLTTALVAGVLAFPSLATAQSDKDKAINQFLADPGKALQQYPKGGAQLISLIRDVAVGHPEALNSIIALLKDANADQQSAIGSGLGQAAQLVLRNNPNYANQIQQAVAAAGSDNASTAFASVTGNVNIAATGGGGGGGGGGGTGGGGGIGGHIPTGGTFTGGGGGTSGFGTSNFGRNYFTGGGVGGAVNSVSPR